VAEIHLEFWVLAAAGAGLDQATLRGLLHLAEAAEAAEVVVPFPVAGGSAVDGSTLKDLQLNIEPGFTVLAVRRGGGYLYRPRGQVRLSVGDEVIASGPDEGQALLAALCGWELVEDDEGEDELVPAS